ncbi:hypothetical protein [Rarobacter incanus]|uniref:Uncharacterized protein n=1 Tax=Rarobacter incanus TaxID=153494 RepID=A0A542SME7_9MICO|nr:hypothetical protein [Rarobacter incanus]TQK75799.1 hypothetical protein FB389_0434 [Rarobacter incanus]
MSTSHEDTPEPPAHVPTSHEGGAPTHPSDSTQPNANDVQSVNRDEAGASADPAAPFDLDEEFRKLARELDDIPGFRNLQPLDATGDDSTAFGGGPRDWSVGEDVPVEGEFVPPDPEVRLDGSPARIVGWLFVLLGSIGSVLYAIFHAVAPAVLFAITGSLLVVGVVVLLLTLPKERDDWDTGAQV